MVNRADVLEHMGGDVELMRKMVPVFLDESLQLFAALEQGLARDDRDAVEQAAHGLKSALGHWTQGDAFAAARDLEEAARSGTSQDLIEPWGRLCEALPIAREGVSRLRAQALVTV